MKFTAKLLYGSAREKRKGHQNLRFSLFPAEICSQKAGDLQQLDQPEATMPADKCLFQLQGKMAFGKHLNHGALHHQWSTPLLVQAMNYTHPVAGWVFPLWALWCVPGRAKCWFDAWHFNFATLPETWPTLAIIFEDSKRLLIVWPKSLFSRTAMFSFSSSEENTWSE